MHIHWPPQEMWDRNRLRLVHGGGGGGVWWRGEGRHEEEGGQEQEIRRYLENMNPIAILPERNLQPISTGWFVWMWRGQFPVNLMVTAISCNFPYDYTGSGRTYLTLHPCTVFHFIEENHKKNRTLSPKPWGPQPSCSLIGGSAKFMGESCFLFPICNFDKSGLT
jgi:hypothetical protein